MAEKVSKALKLSGHKKPLRLQWTANKFRVEKDSEEVEFEISGIAEGSK